MVIDDEQIEIDFVITERDTNQRAGPKEPVNRQKLWQDKEKFIVDKTGSWACPDDSHPTVYYYANQRKTSCCLLLLFKNLDIQG